jgi:hypothetical protein
MHPLVGPIPQASGRSKLFYYAVFCVSRGGCVHHYSNAVPGGNSTCLGFGGENVTVRVTLSKYSHVSATRDFNMNYSMWRQRLTADVIYQPINPSQPQYVWNTSNSSVIYTMSATRTVPLMVFASRIRIPPVSLCPGCLPQADCQLLGTLMTRAYVPMVDASENGSSSVSHFLLSVV